MPGRPHLRLVTAIGRRIDRSVCDGAVERRDAWLAVSEVQGQLEAARVKLPAPRRTG
jgi:hypothetical protein